MEHYRQNEGMPMTSREYVVSVACSLAPGASGFAILEKLLSLRERAVKLNI